MIITQSSEVVDTTSTQIDNFTILDSAAIYKLMFSSLYEDKEKIVVQELAANALDAHTAAGVTDVPIEITLPSDLAPELIVKDFGTGMSLETVKSIYPVYGASTKNTENTSIGGFGLGSKSPFALSSSFIVTTTHKSITTTVSCFLDNGKPKFSVFTSENSDLPDGTEVRVPVSDLTAQRRIQTAAVKLFPLWEVKPKIIGNCVKPQEYEDKPIVEDNIVLLPSDNMGYLDKQKHLVAIGPFTYSLPVGLIERIQNDKPDLWANIRKLNTLSAPKNSDGGGGYSNFKGVPRFAIGDLELSPSRETIEPTNANYEKVVNAIEELTKSPYKGAKKEFNFEWYISFLTALWDKGITYGSGNDEAFLGVDPAKIIHLYDEILTPNPTVFTRIWSSAVPLYMQQVWDEVENHPEKIEKLKTLTHIFRKVVRTKYNPAVAGKVFPGSGTSYLSYVVPLEVIDTGLSDVPALFSDMHQRNGTVGKILWAGSRPSIQFGTMYHRKDPRKVPTLLGSTDNRTKTYNWWRGVENTLTSNVVVYTNPEDYYSQVKWLDENLPLHKDVEREKVFTQKDIDAAWANRTKQKRLKAASSKTTKNGSKRIVADDSTAIGTITYVCPQPEYSHGEGILTIGGLKDLVNQGIAELYITSKDPLYHFQENIEIFKNIARKYPIIKVLRSQQNRKVFKDAIAALEKQGVKVFSAREVYQRKVVVSIKERKDAQELQKILDYNLYVDTSLRLLGSRFTDSCQYDMFYLPLPEGLTMRYPTHTSNAEMFREASLARTLPARTVGKLLYGCALGTEDVDKSMRLGVAEIRLIKKQLRKNYEGELP